MVIVLKLKIFTISPFYRKKKTKQKNFEYWVRENSMYKALSASYSAWLDCNGYVCMCVSSRGCACVKGGGACQEMRLKRERDRVQSWMNFAQRAIVLYLLCIQWMLIQGVQQESDPLKPLYQWANCWVTCICVGGLVGRDCETSVHLIINPVIVIKWSHFLCLYQNCSQPLVLPPLYPFKKFFRNWYLNHENYTMHVRRTYVESSGGKNATFKLQQSCNAQSFCFCLFVSRAICWEFPAPYHGTIFLPLSSRFRTLQRRIVDSWQED